MNGWLIDTNVVAAITGPNPEPKVSHWLRGQPQYSLFLSILTLAEYRKAIANLPPGSQLRPRIEHAVLALESRFSGRVLSISDAVALRWGTMSGEAKRLSGHSPNVIDTLLAATAIEHQLYFATRNTSHVALSGAAVFNPWKDDPANFPLS
jgi:predicted nucleic acid-binding protein